MVQNKREIKIKETGFHLRINGKNNEHWFNVVHFFSLHHMFSVFVWKICIYFN